MESTPSHPIPPDPSEQSLSGKSNRKGFAIVSLALGIISLCLIWIPFANVVGIIGSIIGFIFGIIGLKSTQKPIAIAGIVISAVSIIVYFAVVLLLTPVTGEVFQKVNGTLVAP